MDKTFTILISCNIITLLIALYSIISLKIYKKKNNEFQRKLANGTNLEEMIKKYISTVDYVNQENAIIEHRIDELEKQLLKSVQKIGIVRYNAFNDVGSNLSFAIAILDGNNNGIVLNSIYARETSSFYSKPVTAGKSEYKLSTEEIQAIDKAIFMNEKS